MLIAEVLAKSSFTHAGRAENKQNIKINEVSYERECHTRLVLSCLIDIHAILFKQTLIFLRANINKSGLHVNYFFNNHF
jgi:hypothetical protein